MTRKGLLAIKLVVLILIFIIVAAFTVRIWGYGNYRRYRMNNFPFNNYFNDNSSITSGSPSTGKAQSFDGVEVVKVDSVSIPVIVRESNVDRVTITDNSETRGMIGIAEENKISQEGNTLSFRQGNRSGMTMGYTLGELYIDIPHGMIIEYDISTVSGDIIHGVDSKNNLRLSSVSGSIEASEDGDDLNIKSVSGSLRAYGTFKMVNAKNTSGSIRVEADQESQSISCSSVSGSIKVSLDDVRGYQMHYSSVSGSIKDNYSGNDFSKSGNIKYGDGSLLLDLSTTSGSIKLDDWD